MDWLANRDVAPGTLRNEHGRLASFLTWLVVTEHVPRHPMAGIKPPPEPRRLPRGLPTEAVSKLLATLDARGQLIVSLMVQEGLRDEEACNLQVADIDFDNNAMLITGKGGHQRVLPLSEETRGYLRRYLAEDPVTVGPILRTLKTSSYPGRPLRPDYLSKLVARWMYAAGIKTRPHDGVSSHALRHTCATDMLRAGAHVRDVQAALGHSNLGTTSRYLPWVTAPLEEAMSGRRYGI